MPATKAIIIPGNGCGDCLDDCMWYPWAAEKLQSFGVNVTLTGFPDHLYAHEAIWKEFAVETLGLDESTVVIGHSSGAACALRLMEEHRMYGCLLVSAYDNDLGDDLERESGYFSREFDYDAMIRNVNGCIVQCHSATDHLVPVAVGRRVAEGLRKAAVRNESKEKFRYIETSDDGHFQDEDYSDVFGEDLEALCS